MSGFTSLPIAAQTVLLLIASNAFMTMAWYYLGAFDCVWGHTDLIASEPDNSARIVRVRSA